jgi:hypothetical protein
MSPRILKLVGTLFLVIGVFSLMFRVFGADFALIPWPVSLIVVAIGVFFLKLGGGVEGWTGGTRRRTRPS